MAGKVENSEPNFALRKKHFFVKPVLQKTGSDVKQFITAIADCAKTFWILYL